MAMNVGKKGALQADINVTPLVDVVLVLLIIFMVLTPSLLKHLEATIPVLGVCLGHQVIATALGATVDRVAPRHGRTSAIHHGLRTVKTYSSGETRGSRPQASNQRP